MILFTLERWLTSLVSYGNALKTSLTKKSKLSMVTKTLAEKRFKEGLLKELLHYSLIMVRQDSKMESRKRNAKAWLLRKRCYFRSKRSC